MQAKNHGDTVVGMYMGVITSADQDCGAPGL